MDFPLIQKFEFLEKGLAIVSLTHFVYDFSRNMFLIYSINLPNLIARLTIVLWILDCIVIVC